MNYAETISQLEKQLQNLGEAPENLAYVFRDIKGWTLLDYILHQNQSVTSEDEQVLAGIMSQLSQHRSLNTSQVRLISAI